VIEACNFRCGYCMPADRVPDDYGMDAATRLSFDEIETLVRGLARLGVRKLRLTGGEPLLRKRLPARVARLGRLARRERPAACPTITAWMRRRGCRSTKSKHWCAASRGWACASCA